MLDTYRRTAAHQGTSGAKVTLLTAREREVLHQAGLGQTNAEVAARANCHPELARNPPAKCSTTEASPRLSTGNVH